MRRSASDRCGALGDVSRNLRYASIARFSSAWIERSGSSGASRFASARKVGSLSGVPPPRLKNDHDGSHEQPASSIEAASTVRPVRTPCSGTCGGMVGLLSHVRAIDELGDGKARLRRIPAEALL